jgi:Dyp-type peroxidase family
MAQPVSEYHDIQGLFRSGYGSLPAAGFFLLHIVDEVKAKAWLAAIAGEATPEQRAYRVTSIEELRTPQERALQIAFTASGIEKLGAPGVLFEEDSPDGFSREFRLGMAGHGTDADGRSRRLGDIGNNAPCNWDWGGRPTQTPHVLLMLYAAADGLDAFEQMVLADLAGGFAVFRALRTARVSNPEDLRREPFGFVDGISQPQVDWDAREPSSGTRVTREYRNLIAAGEFLLGYENEYALCTQRPLVDPAFDPENILPTAADCPSKRDLGRNGSYLVFRQLEQDVAGFWHFVRENSPADGGIGLAEAMVGRRLATGDPLISVSGTAIPRVDRDPGRIRQNGFLFDSDPNGLSCPFGAHIRRANPRTADLPGGKQGTISILLRMLGLKDDGPRGDLISSSRFHRIIRRGRAYGPVGADIDPDAPRGLFFICLNANIARQFEFIQNAWLATPRFNGMSGEADPLLGNRLPSLGCDTTDAFALPQPSGVSHRISGLPQFAAVRGGAYFFLPGIRALRFLARPRHAPA